MSYDPQEGTSPYLGMDRTVRYGAPGAFDDEFGDAYDEGLAGLDTYAEDDAYVADTFGATEAFDARASYDDTARYATDAYDEPVERTTRMGRGREIPPTVRRPQSTRPFGRTPRTIHRPAPVAPVPSPPQQAFRYEDRYDDPYEPRRRKAGPLGLLAAFLLFLVALVLRLGAIACSGMVVACAVLTGSRRVTLVQALNLATDLVPPTLLGRLVYETPFGGVLRGDIIILSLLLFLADWLCLRTASRLRHPDERGA